MWFTRRDLLKAGFALPIGVAGSEAAAAQAAADSVWTIDNGILTAARRVQSDHCCVPRRTAPPSGRSLTGTLRLNDGSLIGLVLNSKRLTWATPLEQFLPDLARSMHQAYRRIPLSFVAHETTGLEDNAVKGRILPASH